MPMSIVEYTFLGPFLFNINPLLFWNLLLGMFLKKWFLIKPFYFDKFFPFFYMLLLVFNVRYLLL
jgi:hypothetical protein